ncbi:unnamed protein product (macronuclear) [Paramecium tetraurelia]|uniref:Uncharacterized protein n=1 Tax=Paramecium tetraurelia TaxID=5888 RepID=A0CJX3_PARTE|nr:uncharacterized protein GSPATT00000802001 [Paramecium tetraurelia]CAK71090.1 unnamed protein product [Paramecium tetraurelia]|eukprot:XP_001438487.1 hypothetical protein (macronuclear) [Paramecium tetraurelia strain d4-2]
MNCQRNQSKLQYFLQISENEYQCQVCQQKLIFPTKLPIEQALNDHLLSNGHLNCQYEILFQLGCNNRTFGEFDPIDQQVKKQKLFHLQKAKDLKQQSKEYLNNYFGKCLQKITCVINKRRTTQKTYIIILKRFYNYIMDQASELLQENFILQFLNNEQFKQNSIQAIKFQTKSLCWPLSAELLEKVKQLREDQLKIDKEIALESFNFCKDLIFLLFRCHQQRLALIIVILFELDFDLQVIPELKYEDILNERLMMSKNNSKKPKQSSSFINEKIQQLIDLFVRKFNFEKTSFILPEIRTMRDLQTLLHSVKHDFESHKQEMNERQAQFIQSFTSSSIKYISRILKLFQKIQQFENQILVQIYQNIKQNINGNYTKLLVIYFIGFNHLNSIFFLYFQQCNNEFSYVRYPCQSCQLQTTINILEVIYFVSIIKRIICCILQQHLILIYLFLKIKIQKIIQFHHQYIVSTHTSLTFGKLRSFIYSDLNVIFDISQQLAFVSYTINEALKPFLASINYQSGFSYRNISSQEQKHWINFCFFDILFLSIPVNNVLVVLSKRIDNCFQIKDITDEIFTYTINSYVLMVGYLINQFRHLHVYLNVKPIICYIIHYRVIHKQTNKQITLNCQPILILLNMLDSYKYFSNKSQFFNNIQQNQMKFEFQNFLRSGVHL